MIKYHEVELVNLTPHSICIITGVLTDPSNKLNIPPSGKIARIDSTVEGYDFISHDGFEIEVAKRYQGKIQLENKEGDILGDFPLEHYGIIYITSGMVMEHIVAVYPYRRDVVSPDTTLAIRDKCNRIIGVPSLTRIYKGGV